MDTQKDLKFYEITRIIDLFTEKNWPIDEINKSSLYNRFLQRYQHFNTEGRTLFLKLSQCYQKISLSEYQELIIQLMEQAVEKYYTAGQDVWVYPIKKFEHLSDIKSADLVAYLCKTVQTQYSDRLYKKKFRIINSLQDLEQKKQKLYKKPLLLLDDFIGSGKYVCDVVQELFDAGISKENIVICTLYLSEAGNKQLTESGYSVEYLELVSCSLQKLSPQEQNVLQTIENSLGVSKEFHFGYGESATLITLLRTPNNSLPMFWFDKGRSHSAPFPR